MNRSGQLDELEISFWGRVLRQRWKLIALVTLLVTAATVGAVLNRGTSYTAQTEIFVSGTELSPEVQFIQSRHVVDEVSAVLGYRPDVSVTASDTSFVIGLEGSGRTAEEATRAVDTYAATYVTLRERAADDAWQATVTELERAVAQTQQELALVPVGDPEGKVQRLEREFAAYQDALAAAANGSFAAERGRPVVLAQAVATGETLLASAVLYGLAAAAVGLVAGLGLAAMTMGLRRGIGEPRGAVHALRAPLLGTVPSARELAGGSAKARPRRSTNENGPLARPGTPAAEAIALVRARLRPSDREILRGAVQVCSAAEIDRADASAVALNLAHSCARSGTRCILVWADYRHSSDTLAELGIDTDGAGLTDALARPCPRPRSAPRTAAEDVPAIGTVAVATAPSSTEATAVGSSASGTTVVRAPAASRPNGTVPVGPAPSADETSADVRTGGAAAYLHATAEPRLRILGPGLPPESVVDLLSGRGFDRLLTKLTELTDLVIVYTPPLDCYPEAQIVGRAVDESVVVVSARTRHDVLERAGEDMRAAGASVDGIVFAGPTTS